MYGVTDATENSMVFRVTRSVPERRDVILLYSAAALTSTEAHDLIADLFTKGVDEVCNQDLGVDLADTY